MDGLVERTLGLDDEVVQARLGRVDRNADHDIGKTNCRVRAGEVPGSAKAAAIG